METAVCFQFEGPVLHVSDERGGERLALGITVIGQHAEAAGGLAVNGLVFVRGVTVRLGHRHCIQRDGRRGDSRLARGILRTIP